MTTHGSNGNCALIDGHVTLPVDSSKKTRHVVDEHTPIGTRKDKARAELSALIAMYEASGGKPNERPKLGRRRLTTVCDDCSTKQRADVEFAQANPNCPVCHRRRRWEWS